MKPVALARRGAALREQMLVQPAGTRLVFPTVKGGVYSKSGFRSVWLPALLATGFAHADEKGATVADYRFHWLRHTAISLMARAGMKPELIADRVGHKDGGALIYRRYRHLFPSEIRAAVGLLDELLTRDTASSGEAVVCPGRPVAQWESARFTRGWRWFNPSRAYSLRQAPVSAGMAAAATRGVAGRQVVCSLRLTERAAHPSLRPEAQGRASGVVMATGTT